MTTATVTPSDVDYTGNNSGSRDLTQTTDGRLRTEATASGTLVVSSITVGTLATSVAPYALSRKYLSISNQGATTVNLIFAGNTTAVPLAGTTTLFGGGFAPAGTITATVASGTGTLLVVTG